LAALVALAASWTWASLADSKGQAPSGMDPKEEEEVGQLMKALPPGFEI
jgi:hypothetical protein